MRPKRGLQRRGAPPIKAQRVGHPGAFAHALERLPRAADDHPIAGPDGREMGATAVRLAAYVTDSILVSLGLLVLRAGCDRLRELGLPGLPEPFDSVGWLGTEALAAAYFVLLWSGNRRTFGMWLFRMRVVRMADGGAVGIRPAIARWLVIGLPGVLVALAYGVLPDGAMVVAGLLAIFVSWIWPLMLLASVARDPARQGLHDRVAGTAVVVADRGRAIPARPSMA